jgi:type II secretory pathway component GspD/PulD (secretin)
MELAAHQSLTELISDWSNNGELMARNIFISSAKMKNRVTLVINEYDEKKMALRHTGSYLKS